MLIRLKRHTDGTASLTCIRDDGTSTWHSPKGAQGRFFAHHDLTHYAVETTLGLRRGFFGLVASGWDISDFGAPWKRGRLPDEAGWVELVVGFLDVERATGEIGDAAEWEEKVRLYYSEHGGAPPRGLSEAEIQRIRERRGELFTTWGNVGAGESLDLEF